MQIETFEKLVEYIRNFETWDERGGYDLGGITSLLGACLDNLQKKGNETDLPSIGTYLNPQQLRVMETIVCSWKNSGQASR
jgi:hypothetical protein